jgi:hypothetical protein
MGAAYLLLVLVVNVLWFGMGFAFFALRPQRALCLLIPRTAHGETSARALAASLPFLGGLNLALAVLSAACLWAHETPPSGPVFLASAVAHATQWSWNLPQLLRGGRAGGAAWDVLRGPMLGIFIVDGTCALLNAGALALYL